MESINTGVVASDGVGIESPLRDTADSAMNKQNSDFSLNLNEFQLMNEETLDSLDINALLSSLWDDEDENQVSLNPNPQTRHQDINHDNNQTTENQPYLAHQSSIPTPREEMVFDTENPNINNNCNNNVTAIDDTPTERQCSSGEMTLEDFLVKAGIIDAPPKSSSPSPCPQQMMSPPPSIQCNINNPQQMMMATAPIQSNIGNPQQMIMALAPIQGNIGNPQQMMMAPLPIRSNISNPQQLVMPPTPIQSNIGDPQQMMMTPASIQSSIGNPQQMMMPLVSMQSNIGNPYQMTMQPSPMQSNIGNSSANPIYGMRNMNMNANMNMNMTMGMHMNGMTMGYVVRQTNMGNNMALDSNSYALTYPIYNSTPTPVANNIVTTVGMEVLPNNVAVNNVEMDNMVATEGSSSNNRKRMIDAPMDVVKERRRQRMIKNRESAARSRARKQVYTSELHNELGYLEEENAKLKENMKELEEKRMQQIIKRTQKTMAEKRAEERKTIRRISSSTW